MLIPPNAQAPRTGLSDTVGLTTCNFRWHILSLPIEAIG